MAQLGNLTLENARIFFKDFSAEGQWQADVLCRDP